MRDEPRATTLQRILAMRALAARAGTAAEAAAARHAALRTQRRTGITDQELTAFAAACSTVDTRSATAIGWVEPWEIGILATLGHACGLTAKFTAVPGDPPIAFTIAGAGAGRVYNVAQDLRTHVRSVLARHTDEELAAMPFPWNVMEAPLISVYGFSMARGKTAVEMRALSTLVPREQLRATYGLLLLGQIAPVVSRLAQAAQMRANHETEMYQNARAAAAPPSAAPERPPPPPVVPIAPYTPSEADQRHAAHVRAATARFADAQRLVQTLRTNDPDAVREIGARIPAVVWETVEASLVDLDAPVTYDDVRVPIAALTDRGAL